jgi:hypothetical protein
MKTQTVWYSVVKVTRTQLSEETLSCLSLRLEKVQVIILRSTKCEGHRKGIGTGLNNERLDAVRCSSDHVRLDSGSYHDHRDCIASKSDRNPSILA